VESQRILLLSSGIFKKKNKEMKEEGGKGKENRGGCDGNLQRTLPPSRSVAESQLKGGKCHLEKMNRLPGKKKRGGLFD